MSRTGGVTLAALMTAAGLGACAAGGSGANSGAGGESSSGPVLIGESLPLSGPLAGSADS
ncbi:MAG: hypothetical protein ACXVRW_19600 [Solirubrobacteraceae bacterium]